MKLSTRSQKFRAFLLFVPTLVLLGTFFVGPMVMGVLYSFTDVARTGASATNVSFVGLKNFKAIFTDPKLIEVIKNSFVYLVFSGIIGQQVFGFAIAWMMQKKRVGFRRFVGIAVMSGWIVPEVVAGFMWSTFFADKGTLNMIYQFLGMESVSWLFDYPMFSVVIANIWKGTAYCMLMFQAALDNLSSDILEAARIDGANGLQTLIKIILPLLRGTTSITFVLVTLGTLGAFGLTYTMTGGGPVIKTTTLAIYMHMKAFVGYETGYGMAIAMFILAIGVALSLVYLRMMRANDNLEEEEKK